ncbi:hypothetical protein JXI42_14405 [bacterium]|nr:hypothetical protein [bacterium]
MPNSLMRNETILLFKCSVLLFIIIVISAVGCDRTDNIPPGEFVLDPNTDYLEPGSDVTLRYRPKNPGAKRVRIIFDETYGWQEEVIIRFNDKRGILIADFKIPENALVMRIEIIGGIDPPAVIYTLRDDEGNIIRGARSEFINVSDVDERKQWNLIMEELEYYPDYMMAWDSRWNYLKYTKNDTATILIELNEVLKKASKYPEALAAVACGYAYTGRIEQATKLLKQYMDKTDNPKWAPEVFITIANNFSLSDTIDLTDLQNRILDKYPTHLMGFDYVESVIWNPDTLKEADSLAEYILSNIIELDPQYYFLLAKYKEKVLADTNGSALAATKYINAFEAGEIDSFASMVKGKLAELNAAIARNQFRQKNYKEAYEYALKSTELCELTFDCGILYLIAAEYAFKAYDTLECNTMLIKALTHGKILQAVELVKQLYSDRNANEWIKKLWQKSIIYCDKAPNTYLTTMDSTNVLIGSKNITALYFWSPEHMPSVIEFMYLDSLAGLYRKTDIQWLAPTEAPAEYIAEGLERLAVKYWRFCPGQENTFRLFNIYSVPYFCIIDKTGNIRYQQIGTPIREFEVQQVLNLLLE